MLLSGDLHAAGASPADTGPEVITPHHQAEAIAAALGSPVRFHDLTCDEAKGAMAQRMLAEFAEDTLDILGFPSPRNAKSTWSPPRCSSSGQCVLAERLRELLDDGTGSIRAELLPLFDALRQMRRPKGALTWTSKLHVQRNLLALARGEVPLTHAGLSQLTPWRSVAYLRDLLIQAGAAAVPAMARREAARRQGRRAPKAVGTLRRLARPAPPEHPGRPRSAHRQADPAGPQRDSPCDHFLSHLAERGRTPPTAPKPMSIPGTRAATHPGASLMPSCGGRCGPNTCRHLS